MSLIKVYCCSGWCTLPTCSSWLLLQDFLFANSQVLKHSLLIDFMTSIDTEESTDLIKYRVLFTPRCAVLWWILATWLMFNLVFIVVYTKYTGLVPSLCSFNHRCGSMLGWSARLRLLLSSVISIVNLYLSTWPWSVPYHHLISILPGPLMFIHALIVRVFESQWRTYAESVIRCNSNM